MPNFLVQPMCKEKSSFVKSASLLSLHLMELERHLVSETLGLVGQEPRTSRVVSNSSLGCWSWPANKHLQNQNETQLGRL